MVARPDGSLTLAWPMLPAPGFEFEHFKLAPEGFAP
jgi:hypothetical protein